MALLALLLHVADIPDPAATAAEFPPMLASVVLSGSRRSNACLINSLALEGAASFLIRVAVEEPSKGAKAAQATEEAEAAAELAETASGSPVFQLLMGKRSETRWEASIIGYRSCCSRC